MLSFTAPATVTWPDVVTAIATALTTLILAAAGAVAALQLSETRSLRQAQVRPFVVIDFDVQTIPPFIYIVISNVGTTMASNVTFAFDQPIESSLDDRGGNRRHRCHALGLVGSLGVRPVEIDKVVATSPIDRTTWTAPPIPDYQRMPSSSRHLTERRMMQSLPAESDCGPDRDTVSKARMASTQRSDYD